MGDQIVCTYLGAEATAPGSYQTVELNIADLNRCVTALSEVRPEAIINLAGIAFAPDTDRDFNLALNVNVGGVYNLCKAIEELKLKTKLVTVSSSEVYGRIGAQDLPVTEDCPVKPYNNYGLSKYLSEMTVRRFERVEAVIVRAFNHIGPGQRSDFVVSNFARQLAAIAAGKAAPVMKVGNLDVGRDFTDVRDIVRGYRLAAVRGAGIYNFCSGKSVAVKDILAQLIAISGLKIDVQIDPARVRPAEIPVLYGSFAKAQRELDWTPEYTDLRTTLNDVYQYWRAIESSA